jgi:DNA-binding beta-propeller fold protein YncE
MIRTLRLSCAMALALLAVAPALAEMLVSDNFGSQVLRFNEQTGEYLGTLIQPKAGGLDGATGLSIGPDGRLWVASQNGNAILRYDLDSGDFLGVFAESNTVGLKGPADLRLGGGDKLYVSNFGGTTVDTFDPASGDYHGAFTKEGPLQGASYSTFGPDGNLYVSSFNTNEVLRYNGQTGEFIDVFASGKNLPQDAQLAGPASLVFRGEHLYVSSLLGQQVLRYDADQPDTFVDVFARPATVPNPGGGQDLPPFPSDLLFLDDGRLLVTLTGQGGVAAFDGATGQQLQYFATGGGLIVPGQMLLLPELIGGDANRDGQVDLTDFGILKENFGTGASRAEGDFNGDKSVDLTDFGILKENFGKGGALEAPVPEPGTAALLSLGLAAWLLCRGKRQAGNSWAAPR